jgi:hypothetical protein
MIADAQVKNEKTTGTSTKFNPKDEIPVQSELQKCPCTMEG